MVIAKRPSKITLPQKNQGWNNLLEFLLKQFPLIDKSIWDSRFQRGKVHWLSGETVNANTGYQPGKTLCYYRELEQEPVIPYQHDIIYQDEHLLVACKPHFLPVTPGGKYINECLLERLREQQNLTDIVPLHRLDRETAGLVLFSVNKQSRGIYSQLFAQQKIHKQYQAVANVSAQYSNSPLPQHWTISNRLVPAKPSFIMKESRGEINACSKISLIAIDQQIGLFQLQPVTGKTHQLRLHMAKIGMPILNDKFYPILQPEQPLSFEQPLQLLAQSIDFIDPINQQPHHFTTKRKLGEWS